VVHEIFPYAIYDEVQQLVLFVQEERHRQVSNLLLGILLGGDEVDGLEVAKVDIPSEDIYIKKLLL
jgi:hypothetical protein